VIKLVKHTKTSAWTTGWGSELSVTELGKIPSITIDGTDVYVFYQDTETDQRIAYDKYTGSWAGETILETPPASEDFVEAKAKWSWFNNFGSDGTDYGAVIDSGTTYYFDGSDAVATDDQAVWTDETNADDGATGTKATTSSIGSSTNNDIFIEGTNAPASGNSVFKVDARVHGGTAASQAWGNWFTLDIPSGGWTFAKIQALEVAIWTNATPDLVACTIYTDSRGEALNTDTDVTVSAGSSDFAVTRVEIKVFTYTLASSIPELDYTFRNSTDNDVYWNTLSLASGALTISVNDSVALTESITNLITKLFINVNDEVTLTENITNVIKSFINVSDNVILSENIKTTIVNNISVSDEVGLTENVVNLLTSFINVSDNVTLSENITNLVTSFISVSDNVTLTEFVDVLIVLISALSINVIDSVALTESISNRLRSFVNVNDNVTLVENIKNSLRSFINVSDEVTLTENIEHLQELII
jgi:hypothetical protein